MLIEIPFTKNPDEWHCIHSAMNSVLKHFIKKEYSLDYINALINPEHNLWVWPFQAIKVLSEEGLFVRLFSKQNLKPFLKPEKIKETFPEKYHKLTSFESLKESINYIINNELQEKKDLTINEIESLIRNGSIPIVILGSKKHLGKYVTITGFDEKNLYYHDTGPNNPAPNKKISKELFIKKWSENPSMNTAIIVYGKEHNGTYTRFHF